MLTILRRCFNVRRCSNSSASTLLFNDMRNALTATAMVVGVVAVVVKVVAVVVIATAAVVSAAAAAAAAAAGEIR
jgi:hypothetical protein